MIITVGIGSGENLVVDAPALRVLNYLLQNYRQTLFTQLVDDVDLKVKR